DEHPERYHALEDILAQLKANGVEHLIIAGDLFDASRQNFADFEHLCQRHPGISFSIVPGNHDPDISESKIVGSNVHIFDAPQLHEIDESGPPFLFLPYAKGATMGESLEAFSDRLEPRRWILIAHGDWSEGMRAANPYEPGIYMPLTSKDIERYQPRQVFLGHIHAAFDSGRVHYAGSPCGLDITETGRRRFLLYDTESDEINAHFVNTDIIFFNEFFAMVPTEDEPAYIRAQASERINSWQLTEGEREKVRLRVTVAGYCSDREALLGELSTAFEGFAYTDKQGADISRVSISADPDRMHIAERVKAKIDALEWQSGSDEPDRAQIMVAALDVIYGE
ncbi:MAG: exonuclease SbcCD subunit D, partial [Anaerolineales bacterium]